MTTSPDPTQPQSQTRTLSTRFLAAIAVGVLLGFGAAIAVDLVDKCRPRFTADRVYCTR
jgi:predicted MFS family arabinose efflux permease